MRLGLPSGNELVLFAMARTVGWIAHASEQLQHGGLIRPRARYVGPAPGRELRRSFRFYAPVFCFDVLEAIRIHPGRGRLSPGNL